MLTIERQDDGTLKFTDDDGKAYVGKFYSDGSGSFVNRHMIVWTQLARKYGKSQLRSAVASAVRNGSYTLSAL